MSFENAYRPYQPQQESSGKAITALVLGICGLVVCPLVLSIPAVIFATLARTEIRESRGRLGGASMAQAGLVLGWVGIAVYGTLFALFFLAATSGDANFWINVG
jgi:multisubunit Na+/H+ antiporter MnhB subunit